MEAGKQYVWAGEFSNSSRTPTLYECVFVTETNALVRWKHHATKSISESLLDKEAQKNYKEYVPPLTGTVYSIIVKYVNEDNPRLFSYQIKENFESTLHNFRISSGVKILATLEQDWQEK